MDSVLAREPMSIAGRLAIGVERGCLFAVGGLLAALLAVVLAAVGARYLAGTSILGADEAALWLHGALVFFGLPLISNRAQAMRLDLLTASASPRLRSVVDTLADAVAVHAVLVLASGALTVMQGIGGRSVALGLPEAWRFAPVVAGAAATLLLMLLHAVRDERSAAGLLAIALGCGLYWFSQIGSVLPIARPSLLAGGFALVALVLGAPLPHALIAGASFAIPFGSLLPEPAIAQNAMAGIQKFLLLAVPFFLLAGSLMTAGGLADRLVRFAASLVGHWRGGMAQTTLVTNLMISGLSGSSIADAAFGAKVLAPGLVKADYAPEKAAAIVAATAVLPNIVPPSVAFLILALATDLSVAALFAGGLVAGLLLAGLLAVGLHLASRTVPGGPRAEPSERGAAFTRALPALGLVFVIVGGIRFGIVTTTEAAAMAAAYALVVALVGGRGRGVAAAFAEAGREAASVGLLIASAAPLAFLLAIDDVGGLIQGLFGGLAHPLAVLLLANFVLLAVGAILDIGAAILLFAPLLMPVATGIGIDPVLFGIVLVVNLMIGGLTPPVGILVYVAARLSGVPAFRVFRAVLPLVAWLLAGLGILTVFAAWRVP
ncbi:TRAP transporter large permease subunit [Consotaella aegiceratis]|uniref:TRAP transporter large permease n=1 Tax=Consotaella aegiceratis TaxID=3097961 RepID=UPI002F40651E